MDGQDRDAYTGGALGPRRGRRRGDDLSAAVLVDLSAARPLRGAAQRAARETQSVLEGTVASRPVVLFCHIYGDAPPYPTRWRWGQLTIGSGQPEWRRIGFGAKRSSVTFAEGSAVVEPPRPVMRTELSAFCPNPRRSLVVELETADGPVRIGVRRASAPTILAVFGRARSTPTSQPDAPPD